MPLAAFIRANKNIIAVEWIKFAGTLTTGKPAEALALRGEIDNILEAIAADIEARDAGTPGRKIGSLPLPLLAKDTSAETHATSRAIQGFNLAAIIAEYRALRASVVKLWSAGLVAPTLEDMQDLTRFNEAVDQTVLEATARYTQELENSRNMFLGILGHDLRNPLGAISTSASLLLSSGALNNRHALLATQIVNSAARISQMITDLLDLTRIRLGTGINIDRLPMDMAQLCLQVVEEMKAFYPQCIINFQQEGGLKGNWDSARLGQVVSNLVGNALQHGFRGAPITVHARGMADKVTLEVHNEGKPIEASVIDKIFNSLVQGDATGKEPSFSTSLGLGLYIAREIISAHGGTISVFSSIEEGTTFSASLPR